MCSVQVMLTMYTSEQLCATRLTWSYYRNAHIYRSIGPARVSVFDELGGNPTDGSYNSLICLGVSLLALFNNSCQVQRPRIDRDNNWPAQCVIMMHLSMLIFVEEGTLKDA